MNLRCIECKSSSVSCYMSKPFSHMYRPWLMSKARLRKDGSPGALVDIPPVVSPMKLTLLSLQSSGISFGLFSTSYSNENGRLSSLFCLT